MALPDEYSINGRSALWLIPGTLDGDGKISAWGTNITLSSLASGQTKWKPDAASAAATSTTEYVQGNADNGVVIETPKRTIAVNMATGNVKPGGSDAGGGGGGGTDKYGKISGAFHGVGNTTINAVIAAAKAGPVMAILASNEMNESSEEYFVVIIGSMTVGEIGQDGNNLQSAPIEITGSVYTGTVDLDPPTGLDAITPVGMDDEIDAPTIESGDLTNLLAGQVVLI